MAEVTWIAASGGLVAAGFAAWYTVWHRRAESSFERVPVRSGRSVHVLRQDVDLDDRTR